MGFADTERANGNLSVALAGLKCMGETPYSAVEFDCAGDNGQAADAVHTWEGRHYCGYHSPFDVWVDETPVEPETVTVTMGPDDTNHRGNNWYYTYRTQGQVEFTEMTVSYRDVRKGDLIHVYGMWCHVTQANTQSVQFQNFRAGYGIMFPADPADFRDKTRVTVGASDWSAFDADSPVIIRRKAGF